MCVFEYFFHCTVYSVAGNIGLLNCQFVKNCSLILKSTNSLFHSMDYCLLNHPPNAKNLIKCYIKFAAVTVYVMLLYEEFVRLFI